MRITAAALLPFYFALTNYHLPLPADSVPTARPFSSLIPFYTDDVPTEHYFHNSTTLHLNTSTTLQLYNFTPQQLYNFTPQQHYFLTL